MGSSGYAVSSRLGLGSSATVNTPPPKGGGFRLLLEAGLIDPSGSIGQTTLEIVIWLFRFLILYVLLPDLIGNITAGGYPVSSRPQMLTPISLPQRLVLHQMVPSGMRLEFGLARSPVT